MKSSRREDRRSLDIPSLDIQLREAMSIEELTLSVKKLKKNMSYVIEFLKGQLELIPSENTEEEKQVTDKRAFITGKIKTLSSVENLLKAPSDDFNSMNSDQFITILDRYKDTFTDILVDGRFLNTKDEGLVSKATLTIITSDNYKAALAAIDQLVDAHYTTALTNYFARMDQEKNFSVLKNVISVLMDVKEHTKMHYDIDDQAAAGKLKMVFDKLFSAEEDEELRNAFSIAVADPAKEENLTALAESFEYEEPEIDEVEDEKESELNGNDEIKFTQKNAENFINIDLTERAKEQVDPGTYKQESDEMLQENERLRHRLAELEAAQTSVEKKDSVPMPLPSPTPVPVIGLLDPIIIALGAFESNWHQHVESKGAVAKISNLIDKLTEMRAKKETTAQEIMEVTKECVSAIFTLQSSPLPDQSADHAVVVKWIQQATLQMQQEKRKAQVVAVVSEGKRGAKVAKNDLYMIDADEKFTEKDLGIIFAAIQAEGMKENGWQVDAKKFTASMEKGITEFTVPLMLKKPSRSLWSNKQSVNLTFTKIKDHTGKSVLQMTSSPNDRIDTPLWNVVKGIQDAKKTREFINKENLNKSTTFKK